MTRYVDKMSKQSSGPRGDVILTSARLAKRIGKCERTAYRWLVAAEKAHGTKVVGRKPGPRGSRYTTVEAWEKLYGPSGVTPEPKAEQAFRQIAALQEKVADQDARLDGLARELIRLREELVKAGVKIAPAQRVFRKDGWYSKTQ